MKNISFKTAKNDIIAGIIVALVSIPISMGYAQIAGLPAAYGLYGSLIPVLIYAFTTTSPQFVFGRCNAGGACRRYVIGTWRYFRL